MTDEEITEHITQMYEKADALAADGRPDEAYGVFEEALLSAYRLAGGALQGMNVLALGQSDFAAARYFAEKQSSLAHIFEMGSYHEISCFLELAILEKDADALLKIVETMLFSVERIDDFTRAPMYAHMELRAAGQAYCQELRKALLEDFRSDESYDFMRGDPRWTALVGA